MDEKKSISELTSLRIASQDDLILLSKIYNSSSNYNTYCIDVDTFISAALKDYASINDWAKYTFDEFLELIKKYSDLNFVFKIGNIDEEVTGRKEFINVPACSSNPSCDYDLVRKGYMVDCIFSKLSSELSDYSLTSHNHDDRYSFLSHDHGYKYALSDHSHSQYILKTSIANNLGDSKEKVASQLLLSMSLFNYLIIGNNGDVVYATPTSTKLQKICTKMLVCLTTEDVDICKRQTTITDDIVDVVENKVYRFNSSLKIWELIFEDCRLHIGYGRIAYNSLMKKMFFNAKDSIYEISTPTDIKPILDLLG